MVVESTGGAEGDGMDPVIKTLTDRYFQWKAALQEPNENNLHKRMESAYLNYLWNLDPATLPKEWRVQIGDLQDAETDWRPGAGAGLMAARSAVFG
jgi:hypothetical protein